MKRFTYFRWGVHLAAWVPLIVLIVDALNNRLTFNPVQAATQRTGDTAIILLGLSLACSPLSTYLKWRDAIKLRRALGLYAFMYACVHVYLFVGANFGFQWNFIASEFTQKYYLWAGLPAFVILLALAATSFRWAMKRMGKNWTRLHRYIYLAAVLLALHLALVIKGDFFRLGGDVWKPLVASAIIAVLLIVRIPRVRHVLLGRRSGGRVKPRAVVPTPAND
jgi:sulfoxide reductase heme-binding subunit YedZ